MKSARVGLGILELPVPYRCRAGGNSKVAGSLRGSTRGRLAHRCDDLLDCDDGREKDVTSAHGSPTLNARLTEQRAYL